MEALLSNFMEKLLCTPGTHKIGAPDLQKSIFLNFFQANFLIKTVENGVRFYGRSETNSIWNHLESFMFIFLFE